MSGRLEDMELFACVVQAGSFTAAARRLDTSKSRLSRRLSELETRLGVKLLHRTTRSLSLTEAGAAYHARVTRLLEAAREAEEAVSALGGLLSGTIRLAAPMSFGLSHVAPAVAAFMVEHPGIAVDLVLDDRTNDLVGEGFDVAVRIGPRPADSSLVSRVLGSSRTVVAGAPSLLNSTGRPTTIEDFVRYPCLVYSNRSADEQWRFDTPAGPRIFRGPERMRANNGTALAEAAAAGLGLVSMPTFIVGPLVDAGRLEIVLPEQTAHRRDIRLVYPPGRQTSAKLRALADHLAAAFRDEPWECGKGG
jgi:DNA-binding transcriptional LysR family regulator